MLRTFNKVGLSILLAAASASPSFALPRPNSTVRAGANHHLGDDSYIALHGHEVDDRASERERMHDHLAFVRAWLASRPATKPELAARRAEILAHFDAYIAKYTTPKNDHVPWRTPVFIDGEGTICAVGYLIEQTAGRELPERIAAKHRYDYIEEIARDMPEVAAWVASSGFTLDEIAHIQPAYEEPNAYTWRTWDLAKYPPRDGEYDKLSSRGSFSHGRMEGAWEAYEPADKTGPAVVVGRGVMKHGAGEWTSFADDGTKLAQGRYAHNVAEGPWKMFYPDGRVSAEGRFADGTRVGRWQFYRDDGAHTPIASGRFDSEGWVDGTWEHFDAQGKLLATTTTITPSQWNDTDWTVDGGQGSLIDVVSKPGEVHHQRHSGVVNSVDQSLARYSLAGEQMYVHDAFGKATMYDANGFALTRADDGTWTAGDCHWSAKRKAYAAIGDIVPLHGALYTEVHRRVHPKHEGIGSEYEPDVGPTCSAAVAVAPARAQVLEKLYAERVRVDRITTDDVRAQVLAEEGDTTGDAGTGPSDAALVQLIESHMTTYIEWPHIDGAFEDLFKRMAGRKTVRFTDGDPEAEGRG